MDITPYMNKKQLSQYLGFSRPTIDKYIDGMWTQIPNRYPRYVIAGRRINLYAMIDYMTYKEWLEDKNLVKQVPEFNPIAIARLCGQEGELKWNS